MEIENIMDMLHIARCIGANSVGANAPLAKKLWWRCPQVGPTGILLCEFSENCKMSQFLHLR